jgi:hypothetical protein
MGEGGETGSRGHLSVQFSGRHGSQESSPSGCGVALEVVSHCPGLQGSSTELLRNNVGLGLNSGLIIGFVKQNTHTVDSRCTRPLFIKGFGSTADCNPKLGSPCGRRTAALVGRSGASSDSIFPFPAACSIAVPSLYSSLLLSSQR